MKPSLWNRLVATVLSVAVVGALLVGVSVWLPTTMYAAIDSGTQLLFTLDINEISTFDGANPTSKFHATWQHTITNGSGIGQANKQFYDEFTLAGSGSQTYDLDGTLTGPFGTVTFTRIHSIICRRTNTPVASTQDENVNIGGDFFVTKVLSGIVDDPVLYPLRPGGWWFHVSPDATGTAITASTGDQLTFTNASSSDSTTIQCQILGS